MRILLRKRRMEKIKFSEFINNELEEDEERRRRNVRRSSQGTTSIYN